MSALWSAEVVSKDNRRIIVEVRAIHPDSGELSGTKKFAFRLIYDEAFEYGPGMVRRSRGPLGDEVALEQTFDDAFLDRNVDRFIDRVTVGRVRNPLDALALRAELDRAVESRGIRRDDHAAWHDAWQALWDAFWNDPARLPAATYEIDVTDPRWIAHLDRGQTWESAAY